MMDFKVLKWQILHGSLAKRLLMRAFLFALAMMMISFVQVAHNFQTIEPILLNSGECPLDIGSNPYLNISRFLKPVSVSFLNFKVSLSMSCEESENLTSNVFRELMEKNLLDTGARALCVGEGSASAVLALQKMGFPSAIGAQRHPFFSLFRKRFVYELDFKDNYFDFVFSRSPDQVSVPALLVHEIERVLRPGGTGAMLVGAPNFNSGSLVRSAMPVSSFLKSSNVVHVCGIGFGSLTLVIFKKRSDDNLASLEHYRLPNECPSITNNKPAMKYIEPLVAEKSQLINMEVSYLPKVMNISSRNRFLYINLGAGEFLNTSIAEVFKPNYPINPLSFNVYLVDHNISALASFVKEPGISFVYHPGLIGDANALDDISDEDVGAPLSDGKFDFVNWFKETVQDGDFVVLVMNARAMELKLLITLYESGAICHVDELFIRCLDGLDCMSLFKGLRSSGVFVHQWWGE